MFLFLFWQSLITLVTITTIISSSLAEPGPLAPGNISKEELKAMGIHGDRLPDNSQIAFSRMNGSAEGQGKFSIYVISRKAGRVIGANVTPEDGLDAHRSTWSPLDKQGFQRIAYQHGTRGNFHIGTVGVNGSNPNPHNVTAGPKDLEPAWHPISFHLLTFFSQNDIILQRDIFGEKKQFNLTQQVREKKKLTSIHYPAWSPDGTHIAFSGEKEGNTDIYVLDVSDPEVSEYPITRITNDPLVDTMPTWSQDGQKLAFVSNRSGAYQIWMQNMEENKVRGEPVQLTTDASNFFPSFHPNGEWVIYEHSDEIYKGQVRLISLLTYEVRELTTSEYWHSAPAFNHMFDK